MPSQDETLRLAATVVNGWSGPLREMQRSLRSLAAETASTHKAGEVHAKTHAIALSELGRATREATEHFKSGLSPAMSALGVTSISAAAGLAAVAEAVKFFGTTARDLTMLSNATGVSINQLRAFDKEAERLGITAGTMRADIAAMSEALAKAYRVPGGVRTLFPEQTPQFYRFVESLRSRSGDQQLNAIVGQLKNVEEHARSLGKTTAEITAEKQKYLGLFGLPKGLAQVPYKELQGDLEEIRRTQSKLSDEGIKGGLELQKAFDHLGETLKDLKDDIGSDLAGPMREATDAIRDFVKENKGDLTQALKDIAAWTRSADWKGFAHDVRAGAHAINSIVQATTGWKPLLEFLAAYKFAQLALGITGVTGAARGLAAVLTTVSGITMPAWMVPLLGLLGASAADRDRQKRGEKGPGGLYGSDLYGFDPTGAPERIPQGQAPSVEQPKDEKGKWETFRDWLNEHQGWLQRESFTPGDAGAPHFIKAAWSPDAAEGMRAMRATWTQTGGPNLAASFDAARAIEGAMERGSHKGVYDALRDFLQDESPEKTPTSGIPAIRASLGGAGANGAGSGSGASGARGETTGPGAAFSRSPMGNLSPDQTGQPAKPQYPTSLDQLGGGSHGTPSKGDPRGMLAAVRQAAIKNGINPDLMERTARSEGLTSSYAGGDRGTSFGAMQLHRGGAGSVGTEFERQTGLSLSDPRNEKAEIDFAAKWIKNHGWAAWSGARNQGITGRTGVGIDTSRWAHEMTPSKPPQFTLDDIRQRLQGAAKAATAAVPQSAVHPGADIAPGAVPAVGGKPPQAFIFHHTGGRGTIEGVQETLRQRGLGVEYAMDRDGNIRQIGRPGAANILPGYGVGAGLNNRNIVGMEVIGKNDADINAAQIKAAQEFINKNYPNTPVYGHGEVNPGHKEATEGLSIVNAIRNARASAGVQQSAGASLPGRMSPEDLREGRNFYGPLLGAANKTAESMRALHGQALRDHFGYRGYQRHADFDILGSARKAGLIGPPMQHEVKGNATLEVNLNGLPAGSRTKLNAGGMFRTTTLRRGPAMALARDDA